MAAELIEQSTEGKEILLESEALTVAEKAQGLAIIDQTSYDRAAETLKGVMGVIDKINSDLDPQIKSWNEGHKKAIALKKKLLGQLPDIQVALKNGIARWDEDQRRIREAEARRAAAEAARLAALAEAERLEKERQEQAEAAKRDEEARLDLALEAESFGATHETINEIISTPIIQAPSYSHPIPAPRMIPVMPTSYQKSSGVSTSESWIAEVFDLMALCRAVATGAASTEFIQPNLPALNKIAKGMKLTMNIPGVRAVSSTNVRVRR